MINPPQKNIWGKQKTIALGLSLLTCTCNGKPLKGFSAGDLIAKQKPVKVVINHLTTTLTVRSRVSDTGGHQWGLDYCSHCRVAEMSLLPWNPPVVVIHSLGKVKRCLGRALPSPSLLNHFSHLRTIIAASEVQADFPKLDCTAQTLGAIFKNFWLWSSSFSPQLSQYWSISLYSNYCCSTGLSRWSPFPQATSWSLPCPRFQDQTEHGPIKFQPFHPRIIYPLILISSLNILKPPWENLSLVNMSFLYSLIYSVIIFWALMYFLPWG